MSYIGTQPSYGAFEKQFYTGNGTNTVYNLDHVVNTASSLLVSVNGVILEPDVSYTVNAVGGSSNITFTTAPGNGHRIFIVYMGKQLLSAPEITPHIDEFNGDYLWVDKYICDLVNLSPDEELSILSNYGQWFYNEHKDIFQELILKNLYSYFKVN